MSDTTRGNGGGRPTGGRPMAGRPMGGPGGPGFGIPGDKPKDFKGTLRRLVGALGRYRVAVVAVLLVAVASTVFTIIGPRVLGRATTTLFEGVLAGIAGTGGVDFAAIGTILLTVLALYLASSIAGFIQGWIMAGISAKMTYRFRRDLAEKINRLPLSYFDGTSHGEVLSRITNDVDTVNRTLSQSLSQIVTSVVTVLGVLVMMFSISAVMTLVSLVVLPVSATIVRAIIKRSQKHFKAQQEYIGHINAHVEEIFGGHLVVKAFNGEPASIRRFRDLNGTLYNSAWKSQFFSGLMMPIMMFVGNLGYVAVSILGGYLAVRRAITVGDIQAFIQYVRAFTQPIAQLATISNVLQQTTAAAERVFAFLDEPEEAREAGRDVAAGRRSAAPPASAVRPAAAGSVPATVPGGAGQGTAARAGALAGRVEFDDVHFAYTPGTPVISGFSAVAEPGSKVAIVGPTGAGKTTMVKLLMRFYDLSSGEIRIDGASIADYSRGELRRLFGMVLQDTWLFHGTIMENIRYGRLDATDEEVVEAARVAHAEHFIRTLPGAYEMVINEEAANISAGQKQLLTIARAVLADPRLLILDEATSSVDTLTEVLIQRAMDSLMEGRTSFVIAHRLSTVKNADLILVMRDGNIVEQGRHDELLAAGGFYEEIYASQFGAPAVTGPGEAPQPQADGEPVA